MKHFARYGIDAPGVLRAHVVLGGILVAVAATGFAWPQPIPIPISVSIGAAFGATLLLFYAAVIL